VVRLAFAVRPPAEVTAVVAGVARPVVEGVAWTPAQRWIVKLRPLGHVSDELREPLVHAVEDELEGAPPVLVSLGSSVRRLGQQLCAPVDGLDDLAGAVFDATEALVPVTHPQPFRAELVLATGRIPRHLQVDLHGDWTVREIRLIADRSSPRGPRLDDVGTIALTG
jgi:2'-5' RNA ligase